VRVPLFERALKTEYDGVLTAPCIAIDES